MVKAQRQSKIARNRQGDHLLEENLAFDDSLLPSAEELAKLKDVDPTIIDWIKNRTEIEQDARIQFNKDQMRIHTYSVRKTHGFNISSLILGFLLFISVIAVSAFFVYKDLAVQGTIFGGSAIITGVIFFIKACFPTQNKR